MSNLPTTKKPEQYKKEVLEELLRRKKAATSLVDYVQYTMPTYEVNWHHRYIAHVLQDVAEGKMTRVIINMPPRHGKSELASIRFPAWYLGKFPDRQIIFATSTKINADEFGEKVLNVVQQPEHTNVFPEFKLKSSKPKKTDWKTSKGGIYYASGYTGTITGKGANLIIADDITKDAQEMLSEQNRKNLWIFYKSVLESRLTNTSLPKGQKASIVLIQTRWHEDDLAGKLIQQMDDGGEEWTVINIPAIRYKGVLPQEGHLNDRVPELEALWPERYSLDELLNRRGNDPVSKKSFSCIYQQQPAPDEGVYFRKDWFSFYDDYQAPNDLVVYIASDYALSEGKGDSTWHAVIGVDSHYHYWVLDLYKGQDTMLSWIDKLIDLAQLYAPYGIIGESGQIRRASEPIILKRMRERKIYSRLDFIARTTKKDIAARALQAVAAQKKIHIPNTELGKEMVEQLIRFPSARHDDAVDCLANFFLAVDKIYGGRTRVHKGTKQIDRWDRAAEKYNLETDLDWKTI